MKKMFLMLLLAVSTFSLSFAQDSSATRKKHGPAKETLAKQLNLNKEQEDKIKASKAELKAKTKEIKANTALTEEQKKAQLKEARKESKKEVDAALTPEQKAKLKELHAKKKASSPPKKKVLPKPAPAAKN
jgi:Spy/CpxP family protein refolding chaperone